MELSEQSKSVIKRRYLKRNDKGNVVENPRKMFKRVAGNIAQVESNKVKYKKYKNAFYYKMSKLEFLPNSPTLMNAGNDLQMLSACFVLPVPDSIKGIFDAIKNAAIVNKAGGGTGFSFSNLRPEGDIVKTTGGIASGPISFMRVFDAATEEIKQGGKRRGANMGVLRYDHPDIMKFITCKDNENVLNSFNISVAVDSKFIEAVRNRESYDLISPRNGEVVNKAFAPAIWYHITKQAHKNGEPGLLFIDRINNAHPIGKEIEAVNPCGEQPLLPYGSCNLGSINLTRHLNGDENNFDWKKLKYTTEVATRFLDNVIDMNEYPLRKIENETRRYRKIGLGVMGWHEALMKLGIRYDSEEAIHLAEEVMSRIQEWSHNYSAELADEKGAYVGWEETLPYRRNLTTTTIAPTGTISQAAYTTSGIEPLFKKKFMHKGIDKDTEFSFEFLEDVKDNAIVTAHEIDPSWHVKMQAAFQKYTDNAVSKTVNLPNNATIEDVEEVYMLAYDLPCKGITVYRDGSRTNQVLDGSENNQSEANSKDAKIYPVDRPRKTKGNTTKFKTGCGNLYVGVMKNNKNIFETFMNLGSDGGCLSQINAVSRLISLTLRSGIAVEEIIDQLKSVPSCNSCTAQKDKVDGRSCPHIVAQALREASKDDLNNMNNSNQAKREKCPECGTELYMAEGCKICSNCGWSKCS